MRKTTRIWIIVAAALVASGFVLFVAVMSANHWDFSRLNTGKYETTIHEISEDFSSLSVKTETADIAFAISEDGSCKVACYENEKEKYSVAVQDDTLVIKRMGKRNWFGYIGISISSPRITVYLPKTEYNSFHIETDTGNIQLEDISVNSLALLTDTGKMTVSGVTCSEDVSVDTSTGNVNLRDTTCENVLSEGNTANIVLENVIATGKFSIETDTGNVRLESCDAAEIYVETDTGNVSGTLLSDKVFITETDIGCVDVPKSITGGRCEIFTDTGNIKIDVTPQM